MIFINSLSMLRLIICTALLCALVSCHKIYAQEATKDPVAEAMLIYQRSYGGWPKAIGNEKVDYNKPISEEQRREISKTSDADDATIDNKATSREIIYLVNAYGQTKNSRYLEAAKDGIDYLLKAQYENGGWPQYYPNKKIYRAQVTYNDDAMINVLNILLDVSRKSGDYAVFDDAYAVKARMAVEKGIACILKTQVIIDGKLTAWAAQYDEKTLVPA
jgi:PelA/Pel-15E family pectate lyase